MSRNDQLISDYLDGRLDPAAAEELADQLEQDSVLRNDFIEFYRQHRLLSEQRATSSDSVFVQCVLSDLRAENRQFASEVLNELRQQRQQSDLDEPASQVKRSSRSRTSGNQSFWFRLFRPS